MKNDDCSAAAYTVFGRSMRSGASETSGEAHLPLLYSLMKLLYRLRCRCSNPMQGMVAGLPIDPNAILIYSEGGRIQLCSPMIKTMSHFICNV
jgi:hypothetical protein